MKTEPIIPAPVAQRADGVPISEAYADVYHPASGAASQARHVFLAGNRIPERWRSRDRFVVLETGFGLGNNFLATWDAWRRDPSACDRLHFLSIERHPPTRETLRSVQRDAGLRDLADQLAAQWPPLSCNLHRLVFDEGRVELLLALGDVAQWLPELVARVDAFYLDGFSPAKNPQMWQGRLFKAMGRMAAPDATAATWSAARAVRDGLVAAGFEVHSAPGVGGKRDITIARYAPRATVRVSPSRRPPGTPTRGHAAIVGAGLAGCACADALAAYGWTSTLLDRHADLAQEASGNPAGLFHGIVNSQDGLHARFNRAAALHAERVARAAIASGSVAGAVEGLLRLEAGGVDAGSMHAAVECLGLPPEYVRVVTADAAAALSGLPLRHPAWFFPGGGWLKPGDLCRHFVRRAGSATIFRGGADVHGVQRRGDRWELCDTAGAVIVESDIVVFANGGEAFGLAGQPMTPLRRVRGQISIAPAHRTTGLPRVPITGAGYLLPEVNGLAIFGATSQFDDEDPRCREADHAHNLAQFASLTGNAIDIPLPSLSGRVGWRWTTHDRLPVVGAMPDLEAARHASRLDQPRFVPRMPGLYVSTALGSRGIAWCGLAAQLIASMASDAPLPLEASLLDAIDPARFVSRNARRSSS